MRIELPSSSWADAHRAQDDAHTLTLPAQRPVSLTDALLAATGEAGDAQRVQVQGPEPVTLTFTL
jgi:hypothetical protein